MPELPEVENVKLSLHAVPVIGQTIVRVERKRANLRTLLSPSLSKSLPGESIRSLERRAKYLVFSTDRFALISHLGMTGWWRAVSSHEKDEELKHDHLILHFQSGWRLIYNDPRRFGIFEITPLAKLRSNPWLENLGVEPLAEEFTGDYLFARTRKRKVPIKALIMDQKIVVGVGNIYASEALHLAKILPTLPAHRLTLKQSKELVEGVRTILQRAIQAGGSSISDYRQADGREGSFQNTFQVYDRAGETCFVCSSPIRSRVIAGRNTFWCAQCQR